MKEFSQVDFSGGMLEQTSPFDFTERQVSKVKGFVFDDEQLLRSQWAIQRIGGISDVKAIYVLGDDGRDIGVALKNDGSLWWCFLPYRYADDTTTRTFASWTRIDAAYDVQAQQDKPVANDIKRRFLCEIPVNVSDTKFRTGLLINSMSRGTDPLVLYKDHAGGAETVKVLQYSRQFPDAYMGDATGAEMTNGTVEWTRGDIMPRANVGAMWGDVLCLADVEWYKNPKVARDAKDRPTLTAANSKRYASGMWTSWVDSDGYADTTMFHPYKGMNLGNVSQEADITGLIKVQAGMLVITAPTHAESDGIVLLRGAPYDYTVEQIRGGVGLLGSQDWDYGHRHTVASWPEAGAVCFVEQTGQVWHTDGQRAARLDKSGPSGVTHARLSDHAVALRGHLFVSRANRLLCLNLVTANGEEVDAAAWTELVTPHGSAPVVSMAQCEDSMYFVQNGELFRFQMAETRARGTIDGVPATVSIAGAPRVIAPEVATRGRWARTGVRAHSPSNAGTLVSLTTWKGSPLAGGTPHLTKPQGRALDAQGATVVVRAGIGPSNVACVEATFTGDVVIDALSLWATGKFAQRTGAVASSQGGVW